MAKPIRFSPHALANIRAREIPRAEVEAAIREPARRHPVREPREVVMRPYYDTVTGERMLLRAVIEETEHEIGVITVFKTSQLKKYLREETK